MTLCHYKKLVKFRNSPFIIPDSIAVFLQVWSNDDFEYIRKVTQKTLPFSHYFHRYANTSAVIAFQ